MSAKPKPPAWAERPTVAKGKLPVSVCSAGGAHHWRIDEPGGGRHFLAGVCRKCGAQRNDFRTSDGEVSFQELHRTYRGGEE